MRCLVLAAALHEKGCAVYLLSTKGRPELSWENIDVIKEWFLTTNEVGTTDDAQHVVSVAKDIEATLLVLDFYDISESYQLILRDEGLHWLQFDGFARRPLWGDWIVSMSPAADRNRYLLQQKNSETTFCLGPEYAILRPEFRKHTRSSRVIGSVKKVMLSFGGGEDRGLTLFCLEAIKRSGWEGSVIAVVGQGNPFIKEIHTWASCSGAGWVQIRIDEPDMVGVMADCDLGVISGGMTSFEAAVMGLPTLMVCLAENQKANIEAWSHLGVSVDLGDVGQLEEESFARQFLALVHDEKRREFMSRLGREVVDGQGAERVAEIMLGE
jgi:spore coat polysaccharide biosynthesis predicted glycosyltransferase SpsG